MELITKADLRDMPDLYRTLTEEDPVLRIKLDAPWSGWSWYIAEFDGEDLCFGLVDGHEREWSYFRMSELLEMRGPDGSCVARDEYFEAMPASHFHVFG